MLVEVCRRQIGTHVCDGVQVTDDVGVAVLRAECAGLVYRVVVTYPFWIALFTEGSALFDKIAAPTGFGEVFCCFFVHGVREELYAVCVVVRVSWVGGR